MELDVNVPREGKYYIELHYTPQEEEMVKKKMEELGLIVKQTANGWGSSKPLDYYQEQNYELFKSLHKGNVRNYGTDAIDEINKPGIVNGAFNLAIFRVVPKEGKVEVPAEPLSLAGIETVKEVAAEGFSAIMNAVGKVKIKFELAEKELEKELETQAAAAPRARRTRRKMMA